MTKRARREKPRKTDVVALVEINIQLGYTSNFPVRHNIVKTAKNGLLVEVASKSQQDKTIIMK
jgi:hypothetical protein